jgi:hypothetical protein
MVVQNIQQAGRALMETWKNDIDSIIFVRITLQQSSLTSIFQTIPSFIIYFFIFFSTQRFSLTHIANLYHLTFMLLSASWNFYLHNLRHKFHLYPLFLFYLVYSITNSTCSNSFRQT